MKKIFLLLSAFIVLMLVSGCGNTKPSTIYEDEPADVSLNTDLLLNSNTIFTEFRTTYVMEFYGLHDFIAKLVDEDRLSEWMTAFENGERSLWEMTLFAQVNELEISEDELRKSNSENGQLFSDEQIEALYSGDIKKVNEYFANPYSLVVDGEIFTPDWLAQNLPDDYIKNGITAGILKEYMLKIDIPDLSFAYLPIAINANAMEGIGEKFDSIYIDFGVNIVSANGNDIIVREKQYGKEYLVRLLFKPDHTAEKDAYYRIRGTYDKSDGCIKIDSPENFHCPQRYMHTD